jgi:carnitine O-acetyltransferase
MTVTHNRSTRQSWRTLSSLSDKPTSTSTYANQSQIPRLPIPDLESSMESYVKSLVPLLEQKVRQDSEMS